MCAGPYTDSDSISHFKVRYAEYLVPRPSLRLLVPHLDLGGTRRGATINQMPLSHHEIVVREPFPGRSSLANPTSRKKSILGIMPYTRGFEQSTYRSPLPDITCQVRFGAKRQIRRRLGGYFQISHMLLGDRATSLTRASPCKE